MVELSGGRDELTREPVGVAKGRQMGEMIHFYEAEIEWTGDKDLKLSSGKLPAVAAGAPPEFKGREGN
jgi:hypothetical protein